MPSTYTTRLKVTKQGTGDNSGTWGTVLNDQTVELLDEAIAGVQTVSVTTGSNITLTAANGATAESRKAVLKLTGAPTANIAIIIPSVEKTYDIDGTGFTGAFTITVKAATGTGVALTTGQKTRVYFDGTNVVNLSGFVAPNSVTNSMLRQSVATSVMGRAAGSTGNVADIAATDNTVLSRVSGTLGFNTVENSLPVKTANTILSGPATGSPATPSFRSLVVADLPSIPVSLLPTGTVVQKVVSIVNTRVAVTGSIPHDDTIPQITEGDEILSVSITPLYATSTLRIEVFAVLGQDASNGSGISMALFKNGTSDALQSTTSIVNAAGNHIHQMPIVHEVAATDTSARTFSVRAGGNGGSVPCSLNGGNGSRKHGGVQVSFIRVTEIK